MELKQAIELLDTAKEGWPLMSNVEDYYKALELSIEAMKRLQYLRQEGYAETFIKLPGEED